MFLVCVNVLHILFDIFSLGNLIHLLELWFAHLAEDAQ